MSEEKSAELAVVADVRLEPMDPDTNPNVICNFDGDTDEQWQMTAWAMGPSCGKGEDIVGQVFALKYWLCHEAETTEDGVTRKYIRTVLIDPNGNAYGFGSEGVYKSLRTLVQFKGNGPYDPPVPITVTSRESGKRRFYMIEPAPKRIQEQEQKQA